MQRHIKACPVLTKTFFSIAGNFMKMHIRQDIWKPGRGIGADSFNCIAPQNSLIIICNDARLEFELKERHGVGVHRLHLDAEMQMGAA